MLSKEIHLARLEEARQSLKQVREVFIISTLGMLLNSEDKDQENYGFWLNMWSYAFQIQKRVSEEDISEAKLALELPLTNRMVESEVRKAGRLTAKSLGVDPAFGEDTVLFHIKKTKVYQKNKGVKDKKEILVFKREKRNNLRRIRNMFKSKA